MMDFCRLFPVFHKNFKIQPNVIVQVNKCLRRKLGNVGVLGYIQISAYTICKLFKLLSKRAEPPTQK